MISILTPTHNREKLIQRTIRSVLAQTWHNWELIIIDDGSTDNTTESVTEFLADKRITYIRKKHTGQADTLNAGALKAKGKYITFLDSDDEAYPDWLMTIHKHITPDTGMVCCGAVRKFLNGDTRKERPETYLLFGSKMSLKFTSGSMLIRREIFNKIGGYDTALPASIQTDLGYRLVSELQLSEYRVVTIPDCLVQINVHAGNRVRTDWQKKSDGGTKFLMKHFKLLENNDPKEISNICATIAFSHYKLNNRKQSVKYLLKAIRHNPVRLVNYARMVKYRFM
jgi:glycosyltransferase involved in cell wall biosynthesis